MSIAGLSAGFRDRPGVRSVALAFLAGGESRRLGFDKITTEFVGGASLLEWMVSRLADGFQHVFVIGKEPRRLASLGIPVIVDASAESASLVGIYTALLASPVDRVLCLAGDMPFVSPQLLRCLADRSAGYDALVPRHGPWLEPLCAVYARSALPAVADQLEAGEMRVDGVLARINTGYLDLPNEDAQGQEPGEMDPLAFGPSLFANANTPEQWEQARAIALARYPVDRHEGGPCYRAGKGDERVGTEAGPRDRIQLFEQRSPVPVVSFVGKKKSGKTGVVTGVVRELTERGYRVAALKHHSHELEADTPQTDSYRLRQAGAVVAGLCGVREYFLVGSAPEALTLEEHVRRVPEDVDIIVTEGFKRQGAPKIEVSRRERSTSLVCGPEELIGIVGDQRFPNYPVPQFAFDEIGRIADLIESRILGGCGRRPFLVAREPGEVDEEPRGDESGPARGRPAPAETRTVSTGTEGGCSE